MKNTKNRKIVLRYLFLVLISTIVSVKSDDTISVYTPCSTLVESAYIRSEYRTEADKYEDSLYYDSTYPNAIYLSEATSTYNCHSFAWNMSEGGPVCWIDYPGPYTDTAGDSSYVGQDISYVNRIEKVSYYYLLYHSAIQTTSDSIFDSKWGDGGLYRHKWNDCPFIMSGGDSFDFVVKCYIYNKYKDESGTHYGRPLIRGKTYSDSINDSTWFDRRIASNSNLSIDSSTVDSGAKVDFAAGDTVFLGSGFVIEPGATVIVRSWTTDGGGLPKRAVSSKGDNAEIGQKKENASIRPAVSMKSDFKIRGIKSEGFYYDISLLWPCNVLISVFDIQGRLISRRDLGNMAAGDFSGIHAMQHTRSGMYIIKAAMGEVSVVKKVVISGR